jgi:hypothetical protein
VKPPSRALARTIVMIRDNEREHVGALTSTIKDLGGTPVKAVQPFVKS